MVLVKRLVKGGYLCVSGVVNWNSMAIANKDF